MLVNNSLEPTERFRNWKLVKGISSTSAGIRTPPSNIWFLLLLNFIFQDNIKPSMNTFRHDNCRLHVVLWCRWTRKSPSMSYTIIAVDLVRLLVLNTIVPGMMKSSIMFYWNMPVWKKLQWLWSHRCPTQIWWV